MALFADASSLSGTFDRSEKLRTPALFSCAARVKIPQLGAEDSQLSLQLPPKKPAQTSIVFRSFSHPEPVDRRYLKKISSDLHFGEDVVKDRCFHMLPYDEKYLFEALSLDGIVEAPEKAKIPPGRHDSRGTDNRHMPCNLTKSTKSHLKPLKRKIMEKAKQMHDDAIQKAAIDEEKRKAEAIPENEEEEIEVKQSFFITEPQLQPPQPSSVRYIPPAPHWELPKREEAQPDKKEVKVQPKPKPSTKSVISRVSKGRPIVLEEKKEDDWDAYVLSKLSKNIAQKLVHEGIADPERKERLTKLLETQYGKADLNNFFLDENDILDVHEEMEKKEREKEKESKPKKKWKKKEASVLQRVYNMQEVEREANDPYSDDNKAPFYRQPIGLRRVIKEREKEEAESLGIGVINKTADIEIPEYKASPPPTIRDYVNPKVGDKLYESDNKFIQEWLTGTEQVYSKDKEKIVMSSTSHYKKFYKIDRPKPADGWYPIDVMEEKDTYRTQSPTPTPRMKRVERGFKRWKALPEPTDGEATSMIPPGFDPEFHRSPDPTTRRLTKQNASLVQVIDEWRQRYHLSGQLLDSTPDDLIRDMGDIQSHVRLQAIATLSKVAEYRAATEDPFNMAFKDIPLDNPYSRSIPEKLYVALECLLEDSNDRVRCAAAITLYSLNRPCDKAKDIMYGTMKGESRIDRWAAAQCLAHSGVCNSLIVGEIIHQLLTTEDTIKHERAISLLGKLSIFSPLVHGMTAELLNSSSWRHKVIACKILPTLHGTINKDITSKLSDLMWNDWHSDVRKSAAQCLGKTSHGKEVHDDLKERLTIDNEEIRLEAINKIGQLGIMTAKLLPTFLKCFEDDYISIRSEVCITCGNIELKDEVVVEKLILLATFDPIWKVKALAFQALGNIGVISEEITECLLWAVRYEEKAAVRAEACHTIAVLELQTEDVAEVLQERFLVESSPIVRDEIAATLQMFGISATEDMDMVTQIKSEVRKLCTRNNIASQIVLNEKDQQKEENLARMIYESQKEVKENEREKEPIMQRIRSMSQASSRTETPAPKIVIETDTPASPVPSREGAVFTPTAEEELDTILSREESTATPETVSTTPGLKSRTENDESESESKSRLEKISERADSGSQLSQSMTEEEEKPVSRPGSKVKFLEVEEKPLTAPSKSSAMGLGSEIRAFSRDAIKERDKINREARNTFAAFDERYADLTDDLLLVDNAYLGKMPSEERITSVSIISEPAPTYELKAREGQADEAFPVDDD
ncbi:HEAT repeat-containing protein 4-like isoform X2 [Mytilus californianus]|uniref:HEAT repeat-containing protein 4-like isoform X2 n=1 Tax=Mytilus californianus TaxID=6549 RepID=UPI00224503B7|nr:HEAT repeat-containing protein 4-like isoform X2 [Mytilus californianus]